MLRPRYLTKSRFKLATECPTKLYYTGKNRVYRNLKQEDSFLAMLAEGGYQVGEFAKCLYPEGIEVESSNHQEALNQTAALLGRENVIIFEAAFSHNNLFVRVDILIKKGHYFELIEVKAKSYDSRKPNILGPKGTILSGMRSYIEDIAFQVHVFKSSFPLASVKTFLMMPDKAIQADINGLNQLFKIKRDGNQTKITSNLEGKSISLPENLLALVSTDEFVAIINEGGVQHLRSMTALPTLADEWSHAYQADIKIPPVPGAQCANCEFKSIPGDGFKSGFEECWEQVFNFTKEDFAQGTVLDIYSYGGKDRLFSQGRVRISEVAKEDVKFVEWGGELNRPQRQWMQVHGIPPDEDQGGYWVANRLMREEMSNWKHPYHFIDFETCTVALPFHTGMHPYEPVAFQFSHHMMHADGRIEHAGQFLLTDPGVFPNIKFTQALMDQLCSDSGTVFMWSQHENMILGKIAKQLEATTSPPPNQQELIVFIQSLMQGGSREMYDLCKLSSRAYFHVDTKGSSSIKKVLPAIFKTSAFLRQQYGKPVYGAYGGVASNNFKNFTWWMDSGNGSPLDPYSLLKDQASMLLDAPIMAQDDPDELAISNGGAAATAYTRLQFEEIEAGLRQRICYALLRYCELDTLAMAMIVQGWEEFSQLNSNNKNH
jgi:hypothetical protein